MSRIIPIRDLRKGAEISEFVHSSGQPIFVTRNGYGDMVIMSVEAYEEQFAKQAVYNAVMNAVEEVENGAKPIPAKEAFARLRAKYAGK